MVKTHRLVTSAAIMKKGFRIISPTIRILIVMLIANFQLRESLRTDRNNECWTTQFTNNFTNCVVSDNYIYTLKVILI